MILEYENTLRNLILLFLDSSDKTSFKVSKERIEKWEEKRKIEEKKNNGILLENRLLYYSDFYDLKTIIDKNWELFIPILKNKKRFDVFFKEIENLRNTIAHGRIITFGQENLLKGILADLKNSIAIYHNKNEMKDDYFIRINKVNDNLGNIWDSDFHGNIPIIRVGDNYEIFIDATDPKDREIKYRINTINNKLRIEQSSNRFNFEIKNEIVGENKTLIISAFTPESDYENTTTFGITVTILPKI